MVFLSFPIAMGKGREILLEVFTIFVLLLIYFCDFEDLDLNSEVKQIFGAQDVQNLLNLFQLIVYVFIFIYFRRQVG